MIRHVVMWKFKSEAEEKNKEENMAIVRDSLYALLPVIPELKKMEIGFDLSHTDMSMDLMLLTEFDSVADMKVYAEHPEHLKVSAYVRRVIEARVVLDAEI
jgi:hypothetical protein